MQKAIIIINPSCHQGKGWKRWLSISSEVKKRLPANCTEVVLEKGVTLKSVFQPYMSNIESALLVSAGGDGSIHCLVNHLLKEEKENARHFTLGAIGLGSSNDFLKPFDEKIKNVPVRIDLSKGRSLHDVGLVTYCDDVNLEQKKFFVVNASVGVTAEANWNFNHPGALLQMLKRQATGAAIMYTAISTILRHRSRTFSLKCNEKSLQEQISNINILKVPYLSGSLFYRQPIMPDDGTLSFNVCMNMSKLELLSVLHRLHKGNFRQSNKTLTEYTTDIQISADHRFVFECDGETEKTCSLSIGILPNALAVLKN